MTEKEKKIEYAKQEIDKWSEKEIKIAKECLKDEKKANDLLKSNSRLKVIFYEEGYEEALNNLSVIE